MNSPITGGAERHTFDLGKALSAKGFGATVFVMKSGPLTPPDAVSLIQPEAPRRLPARILDLSRVIRGLAPDVIVAVNERPVLVALAGRRLAGRRPPIVAISHSTILRNRREEIMQIAYTPLFNRVDSVVYISENQRRFWSSRGIRPRRTTTILNGIDLARFSPDLRAQHSAKTRAQYGFEPGDFVIGLCAVMRPEKNHVQIVDAIASLRRAGLPAKALLVGDGPARGAIEARTQALGVQAHIAMAGMHADVRPFVAAFDVGVLCSVSIETLSLAALEVMAMGIPMVMSNIGGASEIIDGRNGRLFEAGNDAGLEAGFLALSDPDVRLAAGLAARRTVEQRFDQTLMIASYAEHFRDIIASDSAHRL